MEGIVKSNDPSVVDDAQRFVSRGQMRLGVGWECIEVYPFFNLEDWTPEYAPTWAEIDLLASIVRNQLHENQFQSLDPNVTARREFTALLNEFKKLLDSDPATEEILQQFLNEHSSLLCPTKISVWPKLKIGNRITDFVFKEATGDYLLVELEKSTDRLFLKDGHTSKKLNHAHGQIVDWKRYIEDNLHTVQSELGLHNISSNPNGLIVIGRSKSLTADNRRKLSTMENDNPKIKVMTYDDVHDNAKAVIENLFGPIWDNPGNTQIYYL